MSEWRSPSEVVLACARAVAALGPLAVVGKISKIKRSHAGFVYADLLDEAGATIQLRWRSDDVPEVGASVRAIGECRVYAPSSALQLDVSKLEVIS